jgi:hypothetical protein
LAGFPKEKIFRYPGTNAFVLDYWNGASGTAITARNGEIGATWAIPAPYPHVATARVNGSNTIYNPSGVGADASVAYASGIPPSADYTVGARFLMRSAMIGADDGCGLYFRLNTAAITTYTLFFHNSGGFYRLYRTVAGVDTVLGTSFVNVPTTAFWPYCEIQGIGARIICRAGGVTIFDVNDAAPIVAAGRAGIRLYNGGSGASGPNSKLHIGAFTAYQS